MNKKLKNIIVIAGFILISTIVLGMIGMTNYIKSSKKQADKAPETEVSKDVLGITIEEEEDLKITISKLCRRTKFCGQVQ